MGPQPWPVPRQLETTEIRLLSETFRNAIYLSKAAGFDGDDVADVDADAKFDAHALGHVGVTFGHTALNGDRAAHGIDGTGKLDQYSIASRLYDAAGMLGNLGVKQFTAMHLEARKRALLVIADQPAVAGDIGGEDGRQPPLHTILGHSTAPHQGIDR
jgi:hypothetical protein